VRETLRAGRRQVFKLLLAEGIKRTGIVDEAIVLAKSANAHIQTINRQSLDSLGGEANHQGLAAETSGYPYVDLVDLINMARHASEPPLLLLLDHIQDPQNLGSLLRTAEVVGAHGAVIPARRASGVTPAVVRASAGASEHLRVALVPNLVQAMERLKAEGIWLAGLEALAEARPHTQADLKGPMGLVVGSEGAGLTRLVRERCDFLIRLPVLGRVDSLNAGVAGAVALYEIRRQRG
jgi:23S rRNA (guanosine2251-2'-O)-methyltransferase